MRTHRTFWIYAIAAVIVVLFIGMLSMADADAHRRRRGKARARTYQPHHPGDVWADLDHCESGHGRGSPNRFQFKDQTWRSMPERAGVAATHTYEQQRSSAEVLVQRSGWGQFPACGRAMRGYHT